MRPVRIITLVAVSAGGAMGAGWMFQPAPGPQTAQLAPQPAAAEPGGTSLAAAEIAVPAEALAGPSLAQAAPLDEAAPDPAPAPRLAAPDIPSVAALTEIIVDTPAPLLPPPPTTTASADEGLEPCMTALVVTAEPAALLQMTLYAPCHAGETAALSHGPLRIPAQLDARGQAMLMIPALAPQAEVSVTFADGTTAADMTDVPDFSQFARLVLQWDGAPVAALNAYTGGAGWGEAGHIHAESPVLASAGFVTAFGGEDGAQARIFTYPAGRRPGDASVQLEAEVAVTEASCGRPFEARVYTIRTDAPVGQRALTVDMPPCDGTGGFVLMQDILPEGDSSVAALN